MDEEDEEMKEKKEDEQRRARRKQLGVEVKEGKLVFFFLFSFFFSHGKCSDLRVKAEYY